MDIAEEKANTLSRCGSFYYNTLVDESKDEAEFISHVPWVSKFPAQLQNLVTAVVGKSHFSDFYRVIKFTDADVDWRGLKGALQIRTSVPAKYPELPDYNNRLQDYELGTGAMLQTSTGNVVTNETEHVLLSAGETAASLPGDVQLFWDLRVDPSLYVTAIRTPEGKLWFAGQEYTAQYGKLTFTENPIKLFPEMQFMAESCIVRKPHIYNHMLSLGNTYGLPDRVLHYYRCSQTPKTFYLAAAQACGLAVTRNECKIINRMPMLQGYSYSTTDGIYEAPYKHTRLEPGTVLSEGYVIGGRELFQVYGPNDDLPAGVTTIDLSTAVPIPGLKATRDEIVIWNEMGQYRPAYSGSPDALAAWYKYLQTINDDGNSTGGTGIRHVYKPDSSDGNVLKPIVQKAIVANDYNAGESCSLTFTVLTASGNNTFPLIRLAHDYYLISQGGNYIGLSSSATAMRDANGQDPGWAPATVEPDDWGGAINKFSSDGRIYGWISRNATGATGVANALPLQNMYVDIQYKMSTYDSNGLYIELHDSAYSVYELLYMNMGVLDLNIIDTGNLTVRVSNVVSVDTIGLPVSEPGIDHFRNTACANRCLVACMNEAYMSTEMQLRAMEFLRRELPTGSVLVTADLPVIIHDVVDPEPKPEEITVLGTLTAGTTASSFRGVYHAFAFRPSESEGLITWEPDVDQNAELILRSVSLKSPDATSSSNMPKVQLAVYNADEGRFLAVSDTVTWVRNSYHKFTFPDVAVQYTTNLMFVFVAPDIAEEMLLNPVVTGLDVGDDDLTLGKWYIDLRKYSTYPSGWGVISSAALSSTDRNYMPQLSIELVQKV